MSKAAYEIHEPIQATVVLDPNQPQALDGGGGDLLTKLQQLDQCHRDGLLSDSEFASAKQAALSCFTGVGAADAEAPDEAGHDVSKKLDEAATCHEVWERGEVLRLSDVTVVKAEWGSPPQAMVDKTAEVKAKLNGGVLHIEPGVAGDNKLLKWLGDVARGRRKVLRIYVVAGYDPRSECSGPLILVSRADPYAIRVAEARALLRGGTVEMRLASHPGLVVGRKYPEERRYQEWRYTESAINQGPAIRVSYEAGQGFLKLADAELVLDVSFWKMHQGNTVNFVGGPTANRTRLGGGGRDWTVREDGTIAARHSPHLVLGTRPPPGVKGAGYEENFARIFFPVAGHPDWDQGAYHEPCGLCCYTTRRHEHDYPDDEIVGNVIFFPLLLVLYAGTLCYQPCGCICAHQCPWLGDCTL